MQTIAPVGSTSKQRQAKSDRCRSRSGMSIELFSYGRPIHNYLWTEQAKHFVVSLLDRPWRVGPISYTTDDVDEWLITSKWAWPGLRDLLFFKFWDPALHNFSTDEARLFVFSLLDRPWQVLHKGRWMTQRGRGQDHMSYFWSNGTDTRVPQNIFLVYYNSGSFDRFLTILLHRHTKVEVRRPSRLRIWYTFDLSSNRLERSLENGLSPMPALLHETRYRMNFDKHLLSTASNATLRLIFLALLLGFS